MLLASKWRDMGVKEMRPSSWDRNEGLRMRRDNNVEIEACECTRGLISVGILSHGMNGHPRAASQQRMLVGSHSCDERAENGLLRNGRGILTTPLA
jgi:hypothetical protein